MKPSNENYLNRHDIRNHEFFKEIDILWEKHKKDFHKPHVSSNGFDLCIEIVSIEEK